MGEILLNLVKAWDLLLDKGDSLVVIGKHSVTGLSIKKLVICCPKCGSISSSAGNHVYNEATRTYHPSIVHDVDLGGCGYHGWLRKGEFIAC